MALELPQWRCHKIVGAAKIVAIDHGSRLDLMPHGVVEVGPMWIREKHAVVGGYYVQYDDGYASFSPAKAFEEGYAPIPADFKTRVVIEHARVGGDLERLTKFVDGPGFDALPLPEQYRLKQQRNAMDQYVAVLAQRLVNDFQ